MGTLQDGVRALVRRLGYDIVRHYPPETVARANLVTANIDGQAIGFLISHEHDAIQRHHLAGKFYEPEELAMIRDHFPKGGVFLDVGANIGNHAIYAAKFLDASKVIAIEPNPEAFRVLRLNATLNGFYDRLEHHPVGFADVPGRASGTHVLNNMGALSLTVAEDGDFEIIRGDDLCSDQKVDFIKIDTERMEVGVLAGLRKTIVRDKPPIFVEVDDVNAGAVQGFFDEIDYAIVKRHRRYSTNENYLAVPA